VPSFNQGDGGDRKICHSIHGCEVMCKINYWYENMFHKVLWIKRIYLVNEVVRTEELCVCQMEWNNDLETWEPPVKSVWVSSLWSMWRQWNVYQKLYWQVHVVHKAGWHPSDWNYEREAHDLLLVYILFTSRFSKNTASNIFCVKEVDYHYELQTHFECYTSDYTCHCCW
jgi:hypothetical protein